MNIQQNKLSSGGFCFVLAISTSKHIINEILKLLLEHKRIRSAYIIYMWGEVGDSSPVFFLKNLISSTVNNCHFCHYKERN